MKRISTRSGVSWWNRRGQRPAPNSENSDRAEQFCYGLEAKGAFHQGQNDDDTYLDDDDPCWPTGGVH